VDFRGLCNSGGHFCLRLHDADRGDSPALRVIWDSDEFGPVEEGNVNFLVSAVVRSHLCWQGGIFRDSFAVPLRASYSFMRQLAHAPPRRGVARRKASLPLHSSSSLHQFWATSNLLVSIRRGVCCRRTLLLGDVGTSFVTTVPAVIVFGHVGGLPAFLFHRVAGFRVAGSRCIDVRSYDAFGQVAIALLIHTTGRLRLDRATGSPGLLRF
jgi:hypothetical protein